MKSFKMKNRMLAALLCLVTVGGIAAGALLQGSSTASASSTLSGISQLRSSGKEYVILEIVPDTSQAAFAWYVGGSEPVNEDKKVAGYSLPAESSDFVSSYNATVTNLQSQGLLGSTEKADPENYILNYKGEVSVSESGAVSGGYDNNEWFKRFVLDWSEDESEPSVRVYTVSPKDVTSTYLDLADMVVVSGGFYHADTGGTPEPYSTDVAYNLSTAVANEIASRVEAGMPLILDRGAYNTSAGENLNSNWLFHKFLGGTPTNVPSGIYGSVFYYSAMSSESGNGISLSRGGVLGLSGSASQGYLTTVDFHEPFAASMTASGGPFNDVLKSIQSENASRSSDNKLSEDVTMALVVRYLVAGVDVKTPQTEKSSVTILALQPGDASGSASFAKAENDSGLAQPASLAKVSLPTGNTPSDDDVSWAQLEAWTGVSQDNINVVQKTIHEFVASGESLSGTYDMIYIGNDISGGTYGVYGESTQFGNGLGGSGTYYAMKGSGTSAGTSYSAVTGDLTASKKYELISFVNSGRPVILAPYLCAGLNVQTNVKAPSAAAIDISSNMYSFLTEASAKPNVMRQDLLIAGTDGDESTSNNADAISACVSAVNTPTPEITFSNLSPLSHDQSSTTVAAKGDFEYIFKVENQNMSGLTYRLSAMLDVNGDGIYETDATTFDNAIFESVETVAGNLVLNNGTVQRETSVNYNSLKEEQYYRLKVTLPETISGAVSWRLSVDSADYPGASAVAQSSVYVKDARTISVLQVTCVEEPGFQVDLALENSEGVAAKLTSLLSTHGITMTFDTVDMNGVISKDLNAYDVVLVGYLSDASDDAQAAAKLSSYSGNLIFANASMNLPYLDGSASGSHPFAPSNGANLESMIVDNYTTYPYATSNLVSADDFLMYYGYSYFTNMTLANTSLDFWIDVIVAVDQMSIYVEKPNLFEGLLKVSNNSKMTPLIGTSADNSAGTTYNPIKLTKSDLSDETNVLPVYFNIDENINDFHVGVRWKAGPEVSAWYWDSNYSSATTEGKNPLIGLEASTTYNNKTYTEVMGSAFDEFDSIDTSELTFTVELLPDMLELFKENEASVIQIYLVNSDNSEISASFIVQTSDSDNLVEGNEFFYFYYEVDNENGNYMKNADGSYTLADSVNLGDLYVVHFGGYLEDVNGDYYIDPTTGWHAEIPEGLVLPEGTLKYSAKYTYVKDNTNGTVYLKDGEYVDVPEVGDTGLRYKRVTNMNVDITYDSEGEWSSTGGLFQIG